MTIVRCWLARVPDNSDVLNAAAFHRLTCQLQGLILTRIYYAPAVRLQCDLALLRSWFIKSRHREKQSNTRKESITTKSPVQVCTGYPTDLRPQCTRGTRDQLIPTDSVRHPVSPIPQHTMVQPRVLKNFCLEDTTRSDSRRCPQVACVSFYDLPSSVKPHLMRPILQFHLHVHLQLQNCNPQVQIPFRKPWQDHT